MASMNGALEIVSGESFLQRDGEGEELQLVMRDTPPGGTFEQRSAAATAFLTEVVKVGDGDPITVSGNVDPQNSSVFLMDSAQRRP